MSKMEELSKLWAGVGPWDKWFIIWGLICSILTIGGWIIDAFEKPKKS